MVWGTSDLWTEKFFQNLVITNTMIEIAQCERGMFVLVLTSALLMIRNTPHQLFLHYKQMSIAFANDASVILKVLVSDVALE